MQYQKDDYEDVVAKYISEEKQASPKTLKEGAVIAGIVLSISKCFLNLSAILLLASTSSGLGSFFFLSKSASKVTISV